MPDTRLEARSVPTPWLAYGGFEACIVVNKIPVNCFNPEYKDSQDEASAWIPSEANKKFSVYYRKRTTDEHDYSMSLYLDGKRVLCSVVKKRAKTKLYNISCVPVSATETRDFVFNSASFTNVDTVDDQTSQNGIGEIKLVLQAVKIFNQTEPPETSYSEPMELKKLPVKLVVQSGLLHQVGYDSKRRRSSNLHAIPTKWFEYYPTGDAVTLIFRYRSLGILLQARGIVPPLIISPVPQTSRKQKGSESPLSQIKVFVAIDPIGDGSEDPKEELSNETFTNTPSTANNRNNSAAAPIGTPALEMQSTVDPSSGLYNPLMRPSRSRRL